MTKIGSGSLACVRLTPGNEDAMKTGTFKRTNPSYPLTEAQVEQLRQLEGRAPDTADIPPAPAKHWAKAVRGRHFAAMHGAVFVQLDPDVMRWVCRKGPDYQAEINRILRERMQSEG